jgi:protein involved in polysaccharide export with SLBB domain
VSGEVTRPQIFGLRPETSVAQAVIRAGGPTSNAKWDRVRLIRTEPGGTPRAVYFSLQNPADPIASGPVRSGDLIMVDRKKSFLREVLLPVIGLVGSIASVGLLIERTTTGR